MTPRYEAKSTSDNECIRMASSSTSSSNGKSQSRSNIESSYAFYPNHTFLTKQGVLVCISLFVIALFVFVSYSKINHPKSMVSTEKSEVLNDAVEVDGLSGEEDGKSKRWRRTKIVFGKVRDTLRRRKRGDDEDIGVALECNDNDDASVKSEGSKTCSVESSTLDSTILNRVEQLDKEQMDVLIRTRDAAKDVEASAKLVPWGGPSLFSPHLSWWSDDLFASYLIIMKFPKDLRTNYPYSPCAGGTCSTDFGIRHTMEFREKYKPWIVTPHLIEEAESGAVFSRGLSHSKSSILWYKPGGHRTKRATAYTRLIINTLEKAVVESLLASDGKVGKYYAFLDCEGFKLGSLPGFNDVKKTFKIMQDHMPDRLEKIFLFNLSTPARIFMNMVTGLLSEEVRNKIISVPSDKKERLELLKSVMDVKHIPTKFGGKDDFVYSTSEYLGQPTATNEMGDEYITTMPYHA